MPKKFFRRWLPSHSRHREYKCLGFLRPLMDEPNLFHLNRHSVSVAFFVGIFCAFLPFPGQTLAAVFFAFLLRCNLPISAALIWISNPLTMAPLFFLTFELGRWLLDSPPMDFSIQLSWDWFDNKGKSFILPLLVGSISCGLMFGVLGYVLINLLWRRHVVKSWQSRQKIRRIRAEQKRHS